MKFTADAVGDLEKVYTGRQIPTYNAKLPAFDAKKRAAMMAVVESTVAATKQDLANLNGQLANFEEGRITEETSLVDLENRFPELAAETEEEINQHLWAKDSL